MRRLLLAVLLLLWPGAAAAQEPVRVAIAPLEPYVVRSGGGVEGFSIALWEAIAQEMRVKTEYVPVETMQDVILAVRDGAADVGISALPITAANEALVDFSQPMFSGGLLVMVPQVTRPAWFGTLDILRSPEVLHLPILFMLLILVPAPLVWLLERGRDDGIVSPKFFPGVWDAVWWTASCLSTQAEVMPRSGLGRVIAVAWMFTGILFTSYFSGVVASSLTVQRLSTGITGPSDLGGKRVATVRGTPAEQYLKDRGAEILACDTFNEAAGAMLEGRANAVVSDAAAIQYYAAHSGHGRVRVVGSLFQHESYGVAVQLGSRLRKPINEALLRLREDGRFYLMSERWFAAGG